MTTDPKDAEVARLHQQWEDHDAAWSERVAVLTAALAETNRSAIAKIAEATEARMRAEAERDAALAQVARLQHLIREASDPDFLWGAMDNVNDMDADITEFANAASRAIQASIPDPDALSRRDAQMRAEGLRMAAEMLKEAVEDWRSTGNLLPAQKIEDEIPAILAAAEKGE